MPEIPQYCRRCGARLDPDSPHCGACGAAVEGFVRRAGSESKLAAQKPPVVDWIDRPAYVLAATFLALAVFGIPVIWKSRGFSKAGKIGWTIVTLVYTAIVFYGFGRIMMWCYREISRSI